MKLKANPNFVPDNSWWFVSLFLVASYFSFSCGFSFFGDFSTPTLQSTIEVDGHAIYKSALVSQLNGNIFLSKDRLARIKQSIQFNNHANCLQARSSCLSSLLSIGSDFGVHFVQRSTTRLLSTIKSVAKWKNWTFNDCY